MFRLSEQNNDLKKMLSDLLAAIFSPNLLEQAENFQSRFLKTDASIEQLQMEVAMLDELLTENKEDIENIDLVVTFHVFRMKIKREEENFIQLKTEFCNYLTGIA